MSGMEALYHRKQEFGLGLNFGEEHLQKSLLDRSSCCFPLPPLRFPFFSPLTFVTGQAAKPTNLVFPPRIFKYSSLLANPQSF
jgi:hypothetical protein